MSIEFTKEQQNVIDIRNCDVLVSAAAGSGKTAVLVERIIRRILDKDSPLNIDRLLVVTFTEAAAAQMRSRIGEAVNEEIAKNPQNEHLERQAALLYKAQISTIHSFCLNIIRNNFESIGLDPAFRIADETELELLSEDVLDSLFEQKYEQNDEGFLRCVDSFCNGVDESALKDLVLELARLSEGTPWPLKWLSSLSDGNEGYLDYLLTFAGQRIDEALKLAQKGLDICLKAQGPYGYEKTARSDIELIESLCSLKTYDKIRDFYLNNKGLERLSPKAGDDVSEDLKNEFNSLRKKYKEIIFGSKQSSLGHYFTDDLSEDKKMEEAMRPLLSDLTGLTVDYINAFNDAKNDKGMISFSDMEHYALDILYTNDQNGDHVYSPVAYAYKAAFDEILMDEYQDCNRVQEMIIDAVSSDSEGVHNRFMVGDIKQSIYKFRLASPELFLEKYKSYEMYDPESQTKSDHSRIDLHSNFRSRKNVVDTVNDLFGQIMHESLGGVEYDETAVLNYGAGYPEKDGLKIEKELPDDALFFDTEILLADREGAVGNKAAVLEARLIAQKIKEIKNSLYVTADRESKTMRPVEYRDIVILLRSMTGISSAIKKVFEQEGIPCHMSLKTGFYEAKEIQDIIHMLRIIDNPLQEIPLFGAMISYFGSFSDEEAALIRVKGQGDDLYRQLVSLSNEDEKIASFLGLIERYTKLATYTPIHKLIGMLIEETGYLEYISALPGGDQRKANIRMLILKARDYESSSYRGLFNFVRYISKIKETESDTGEADVLDENADVVRVMTIHKSKGLEFPVCFLSGTGKKFNLRDLSGNILCDTDLGCGISYIDTKRRISADTLKKKIISLKLKNDLIGEEERVLYVAMTRAKEKLVITGFVEGEKFENASKEVSMFDALTYFEMLTPLLDKAVVVSESEMDSIKVYGSINRIERLGRLRKAIAEDAKDLPEFRSLQERVQRKYAHPELESLIPKTSVSELKKAYLDTEFADDLFDEKEITYESTASDEETSNEKETAAFKTPGNATVNISGTDRGSAYHKVMELLDFTNGEIKSQIDLFKNNGRISKEWADAVSVKKIERFMGSDIAKRMAKAQQNGTLKREQPFVLGIAANRVRDTYPENETVLLQGIIDAFFIEDGQIVLLDYKTDVIDSGKELMDRYHVQLEYYKDALESILGLPVKQCILYSFSLGQEVLMS
ncbi:MAG: helicase-exonuclease AddAB subunit AddA [Lachnospiraceae bacterium]|nr:helicase-exonuclease AddAB subunit AddA [Lachnospiraceae bacterium]